MKIPGIISRALEAVGRRSGQLANPPKWLSEWLRLGQSTSTASGANVTPAASMQVSTVYSCVSLISDTVAALPLGVFETVEPRGRRSIKHPAAYVLNKRPNPDMTAFELKQLLVRHTLLRGKAYCQVISDNAGRVRELWPLHPDRMRPLRAPDGSRVYEYTKRDGQKAYLRASEVLVVRFRSDNGEDGLSPIQEAAEVAGFAIAVNEYGARFFANDATPGGVLEHPGELDDVTYKRLQDGWNEAHQGYGKARKPAILEEGMKWVQVTIKPNEAQFLETRYESAIDVARIFRVPPYLLYLVKNAPRAHVEQESLEFSVHTLIPWCVRLELAYESALLTETERLAGTYFRHSLTGLLRGDIEARGKFYALGRQWGWFSANDILELEDRDLLPPEVGDIYLSPVNMVPAEEAGRAGAAEPAADGTPAKEESSSSRNFRKIAVAYDSFLVYHGANGRREARKI